MIRSISSASEISQKLNDYVLTSRVYGDYICSESLEFSDGSMYWTDENDMLVEYKNGALTISGKSSDKDELEDFINFIHPDVIMFSDENLELFGNDYMHSGIVMKKGRTGETVDFSKPEDFRLKDFHELFTVCGLASDEEGFMISMSDSIKTGTGYVLGKYAEGRLICGAAVTGITDKTAVVTAIAVDENHRCEHLGTEIMKSVTENLQGRDIFVYREIGKNKEFYQSLGFEDIGKWYTA